MEHCYERLEHCAVSTTTTTTTTTLTTTTVNFIKQIVTTVKVSKHAWNKAGKLDLIQGMMFVEL